MSETSDPQTTNPTQDQLYEAYNKGFSDGVDCYMKTQEGKQLQKKRTLKLVTEEILDV